MMRLGHPDYAALNRFADGDLSRHRRKRVARHLAACERCRAQVTFIRRAGGLARSLEAPELPEDLLDRILHRRAAGDRVILPLTSPGARRPVRRTVATVAAALVVVVGAGVFVSTGLLEAGRSSLRFEPGQPRAGDTVEITYDGGLSFEGLERLHLRVRYRTAAGRAWQPTGRIMERDAAQNFHTRLPLPDSVVYAAFAVESPNGDRVDHNNRALWDLMVHGPDGQPTLDALTQRYLDVAARDPESFAAGQTADLLVHLYPESPRGWWAEAVPASRGALYQRGDVGRLARLRQLEKEFTERPPADPDELAFLAWFAATLGDPVAVRHWATEAERRGNRSRWLAQAKLLQVVGYDRLPPDQTLQELETIWREAPIPVPTVADFGWATAVRSRDWEATLRWLPRYRETRSSWQPVGILEPLREAFGPDTTLAWALAHAEKELLRTAAHRPLNRTVAEHSRALGDARQEMLASMASMAVATDRSQLGRTLALDGLDAGWETEALATIGTVLLEVGDTANAVTAFARVAADPAGGPLPAAVTSVAGWAGTVETARYALIQRVLDESIVQYTDTGFRPSGAPSVVAFLSQCDEEARALRELPPERVTVYATVNADSVREALKACQLDCPVHPDPGGRIAKAFGVKAYTALFVIDDEGRVRFSHSDGAEIPRQLMALETQYSLADD